MKITYARLACVILVPAMALLAACGDDDDGHVEYAQQVKACRAKVDTLWNSPDHGAEYLAGTVTTIDGTLPELLKSYIRGKAYGETVKLGDPTYILHVQTQKGMYVVQIIDDPPDTDHYPPAIPSQTVTNLASAIATGTSVEFARREVTFGRACQDSWEGPIVQDLFSASRIGVIHAKDIRLSLK